MGWHTARAGAAEAIGRRVLRGDLPPGHDLDEAALAAELDLEPVVVRDALCGLERDGFVRTGADGSFVVTALDESELRETYPIVLLLEGLAVRSSPLFTPDVIARLRELNAELRANADDAAGASWSDHGFHAELTRHCGNEQLLATLRPLKRMLLRYEVGYMGVRDRLERSFAQHEAIIDALERDDRDAAATLVEQNFREAMPALLDRLRAAS